MVTDKIGRQVKGGNIMSQTKKTTKKTVEKASKLTEKFAILDKSDYKDDELYLPSASVLFDTQEAAIEYMTEEDEDVIGTSMLCKIVPIGSFKQSISVTLEKI